MGPIDLFWLFLIFAALQPALKKHLLDASRKRLIAKIESERGSRVILLVHRQEVMSLLGFPILRYIDVNDAEEVIRAIHLTDPEVPLDIVLHTPGGLVLTSLQIAEAIHKHEGKVTVFVPHYAMSGGTLIALAADEIVMNAHAVLGPIDPQLNQQPAASILKVVKEKPIAEVDDETLILADQAEKAISQMRESISRLLTGRYPPEKVDDLAHKLTEGTWTHDYPITFQKARELGLHISCQMPDEFIQLLGLYPQPVRHHPSVEFLPQPRRIGRRERAQEK